MAVKPSDLTREQLEKLVGDIVETLYPAANPSRQWSADTIEWVSESLAEFDLIPECDGEFEDEDEDEDGEVCDLSEFSVNALDAQLDQRLKDDAFTAHILDVASRAHAAADAARTADDESDRWPCGELKDGGPDDPHGCPIHGADCDEDEDGETCDECGETIPDGADSVVNPHHAKSCSCHPDNVV